MTGAASAPALVRELDPVAAFGVEPAQFGWLSIAAVQTARAKLAAAAAARSDLVLSRREADALGAWFAMQATALRRCGPAPSLPVVPLDRKADAEAVKQGAIVSPASGQGVIGLDPFGPIVGRSDASSRAIVLACRAAVRWLAPGGAGVVVVSADVLPPVPPAPPAPPGVSAEAHAEAWAQGYDRGREDKIAGRLPNPSAPALPLELRASYAGGYARGFSDAVTGEVPIVVKPPIGLGGVPLVLGAIAAGVLLIGGAVYVGTKIEEAKGESVKWESRKAIAMHLADKAAEAAIARYNLIASTGKAIEPSPLEAGAVEAIKESVRDEKSSAWASVGLGAALGVVGVIGVGLAMRRRRAA